MAEGIISRRGKGEYVFKNRLVTEIIISTKDWVSPKKKYVKQYNFGTYI